MSGKSLRQKEFDGLPEWAKKLVMGLVENGGYGSDGGSPLFATMGENFRRKFIECHVFVNKDRLEEWLDGIVGARELARTISE